MIATSNDANRNSGDEFDNVVYWIENIKLEATMKYDFIFRDVFENIVEATGFNMLNSLTVKKLVNS